MPHHFPTCLPCSAPFFDRLSLKSLGGPAKLVVATVEYNKGGLESDVTEDGEANAAVGLDTAEAGAAAIRNGCEVDEVTGDSDVVAADGEREVGHSVAAGEGVATLRAVVLSIRDAAVIRVDDVVGKEQKGSAGVSNAANARAGDGAGEAPEALAAVHVDIGDGAGVGIVIDVAEVVGAGCNGTLS